MYTRIILFFLALLFVGVSNPSYADTETVPGKAGSVFVFHDWEANDKALQLGDNAGRIKDIREFVERVAGATDRNEDAFFEFHGDTYNLRFIIENEVTDPARITLQMLSLVRKNHPDADCRTILRVNDETFDLRDADNVGSGKITIFSADTSSLQKGINTIQIIEEECQSGGQNDSVFLSGKIHFR